MVGKKKQLTATEHRRLAREGWRGPDEDARSVKLKTVAIYLRVSADKSEQNDISIPNQPAILERYCGQRGYRIFRIYTEKAKSATSDKRPEFQKMVKEACVADPPFGTILVHQSSRLFRSTRDSAQYRSVLSEYGVRVGSFTQPSTSDDNDQLSVEINASFDALLARTISMHVRRSRAHLLSQGFWPGGRPPYGYKLDVASHEGRGRKKIVIDPDEQKVVEQIFSWALSGDGTSPRCGIRAIVVNLNSKGYRTRTGALWSTNAIHQMLTNPIYRGERLFIERPSGRDPKMEEAFTLQVTPIVSPEPSGSNAPTPVGSARASKIYGRSLWMMRSQNTGFLRARSLLDCSEAWRGQAYLIRYIYI